METSEFLAQRALATHQPSTIFRRRWGQGREAFGYLSEIRINTGRADGIRSMEGVVVELNPRVEWMPRELARVDLLRLHGSTWAPVFVSRIRRPRTRRSRS